MTKKTKATLEPFELGVVIVIIVVIIGGVYFLLTTPSPAQECEEIYKGKYEDRVCTSDKEECKLLPGGYFCADGNCGYFWDCNEGHPIAKMYGVN